MRTLRQKRAAVVAAILAMGVAGCGLDEVSMPDGFSGPSGLGMTLKLTVNPDILVADGQGQATVQAEVWGPDGRPAGGRDIAFWLSDEDAAFADLGSLSHYRAATDGGGIAQVIYTAPPRSDATVNQTIVILARLVDGDANGQVYRQVRLELKSPETRLFPQVPGNATPDCNFAIEAPDGFLRGKAILFQSTASDDDGRIVRYFWDFGDTGSGDKNYSYNPDETHFYGQVGLYTVTHVVTDDDGAVASCSVDLPIQ